MERAINGEVYVSVNIGGRNVPVVNDTVISLFVVTAALVVLMFALTAKLELRPGRRQAAIEMFYGFCTNLTGGQIGENGRYYTAYIGMLLLFLALSNTISLFNFIPGGDFLSRAFNSPALANFAFSLHPPTKNFNVTLCLALVSIAVVIHAEFRFRGARGWLKSFVEPMPLFGFVKVLDYVVRPLSLCLRLFGNVLGAVIVMTLLYNMVKIPLLYPAVFGVYFDIFDSILQAYVFVFLTSIYISEAVGTQE